MLVRVGHWDGKHAFHMWALTSTTVRDLRCEASRSWLLNPGDTRLVRHTEDGEGFKDEEAVFDVLVRAREAKAAGGYDLEGVEEVVALPLLFNLRLKDKAQQVAVPATVQPGSPGRPCPALQLLRPIA